MRTETCRPGERGHARRQLGGALRAQRELDVDRRRGVVLVLDLGLGQRRAAVDAPVDRLLALVDHALLDEPAERAHDRRLVAVVHRQVRVVPVAQHAQPLELRRAGRRRTARRTRGRRGGSRRRSSRASSGRARESTFSSIGRPWQSQPGHVRRVEARHRPRPHDEVLEDLVEGGAEVDVAVGVGRAVVQDEDRRARGAARGACGRGPIASQRASICGSVACRFAFIGKPVRGRLSVSFQSAMVILVF